MYSVRVRKLTGLIRNHVFPFSSVVEIQNFSLCSTLLTTCACNIFEFASSAPR